jgi:hypothetical protein
MTEPTLVMQAIMVCLSFYDLGSRCAGRWSLTTPLVVACPNLVLHAGEGGRFVFAIATTLVVGGGGRILGRGRVWRSASGRLFGRGGQLGDLGLECDNFSFFGRWLVPRLLEYTCVILVESELHQLLRSDVGVIKFPIILHTFHSSDKVLVRASDVSDKEEVDQVIVGERLLMLTKSQEMFIDDVIELLDVALGLRSHDGVHLTKLSFDVRAERTRSNFRFLKKGVEVEDAAVFQRIGSSSTSRLDAPVGMGSGHRCFGVGIDRVLEALEKLGVRLFGTVHVCQDGSDMVGDVSSQNGTIGLQEVLVVDDKDWFPSGRSCPCCEIFDEKVVIRIIKRIEGIILELFGSRAIEFGTSRGRVIESSGRHSGWMQREGTSDDRRLLNCIDGVCHCRLQISSEVRWRSSSRGCSLNGCRDGCSECLDVGHLVVSLKPLGSLLIWINFDEIGVESRVKSVETPTWKASRSDRNTAQR